MHARADEDRALVAAGHHARAGHAVRPHLDLEAGRHFDLGDGDLLQRRDRQRRGMRFEPLVLLGLRQQVVGCVERIGAGPAGRARCLLLLGIDRKGGRGGKQNGQADPGRDLCRKKSEGFACGRLPIACLSLRGGADWFGAPTAEYARRLCGSSGFYRTAVRGLRKMKLGRGRLRRPARRMAANAA